MLQVRANSSRKLYFACLAAGIVLVSGCGGGQEASVSGVVTLDGAPLDRGRVSFVPTTTGAGAFAAINEDGSFSARTGSVEGLEPGEYLVSVQAREPSIPDPKGGPPLPGKLITPKKYARSRTSGFQITIGPGSNEIELNLVSNTKSLK